MDKRLLVVAAVLIAATARAHSYPKLAGTLHIRGRSVVDAPAGEAGDTHAAFVVQGEAARALFDAMKAAAEPDECLGDGSVSKRLGNLRCTRRVEAGRYECDFAIDLVHQTIEPGQVC